MSIRRVTGQVAVSAMMAVVVISAAAQTQAVAAPSGDGRTSGIPGRPGVTSEVGSLGRLGPLTDLVIQRLLVSDQVAAAKFGTGLPIDDPVRERQELASVRQSAVSLGIDPDATVSFFQQQINASKVVQRGLFAWWTAHPDQVPTTRPSLAEIRGQLDQLTTELLGQLVAQRHLLSSGLECQVSLDVAAVTGAFFHHLDALHRHALTVALASTCTT